MAKVKVPRIKKGLEMYVPLDTVNIPHIDGFYGIVLRIDKEIVYVRRMAKAEDDEVFFLLDSLKNKYRKGVFVEKDGER